MIRAIQAHLGSHQVGRVIYGAIIGLALVVALEDHPPASGVVVVSLLATGLAVGLAEVYSEVVGTETRSRQRLTRQQVGLIAGDGVAVAFGVGFPAVFFVLAALNAMEPDAAFTVAKWSGTGLIGFYGFCAARLAGAALPFALLQALAVSAVGAMLIAVKALLH